jgi:hypothetical protein
MSKPSEYDLQASRFLRLTGSKLKIEFLRNGHHFADDKVNRDIYRCELTNKVGEHYTFDFGQIIDGTQKKKVPSAYDVLSCLTKYNLESFDNFCAEYGYDEDSIKSLETYKKVQEEYDNLDRLYGDSDEFDMLREVE